MVVLMLIFILWIFMDPPLGRAGGTHEEIG